MALQLNQPFSGLLMTPVQRVTRYNLLLTEAAKCFNKAKDSKAYIILQKVQEICEEICFYANDMMVAGRMVGFPVS